MNRRTACFRFLTAMKLSFLSSFVLAAQEVAQEVAQEAVKTISRIAGPHWNVNGDWTPSIEEIQGHLRHAHGIDPKDLSLDDLLVLHDNDHNRRGRLHAHRHKKKSEGFTKGYAKF